LQKTGAGHFGDGVWTTVLLLCAGPLTVAPLALFAWAARRMPLVALGFLQFIAPTLQFFVGVASGEAFTPMRALAFGFIWIGAAVFASAPGSDTGGSRRTPSRARLRAVTDQPPSSHPEYFNSLSGRGPASRGLCSGARFDSTARCSPDWIIESADAGPCGGTDRLFA
jgi:hypothetical protein